MTGVSGQFHNHLANEKSPYLLQHASNPVDWYPWGQEAFAKARAENKPIFLSIGYSTCHWCHVMEHESFEDTAVARLMNETFVSIKVDREERPDIDNIYMTVCQMMTGGGGWPLTVIMTPDRKPFFAGTYYPKHAMGQRIGMMELVPRIAEIWKTRRGEVDASAEDIAKSLQQTRGRANGSFPPASVLDSAFAQYHARFDSINGGFGAAPKFPVPANLSFLLRYWKRSGNPEALKIVEQSLQHMRRGGMYDQVGFGFHRYSTDAQWLLPHFEKMLYDQAQLVIAYAEALQATGNREYAETIREVLAYVTRDMTDPGGGFYSAEDADSDGEEGKFYVWSVAEIKKLLTADDAALFLSTYNFSDGGNFFDQATQRRTGANIPHLTKSLAALADEHNLSLEDLKNRLGTIRSTLFETRERRIHPHKDDKILADWNGLMIAAFAKASRTMDDSAYANAGARAAAFVLTNLRQENGRLLHRYRDGDAGIDATAEDYAYFIWGLIEMYETTFEIDYLQTALDLNRDFIAHFWDSVHGGFFLTADDAEELIARPKEVYDGAMPSANSVAMLNLYRLARLTANPDLEDKANTMAKSFSDDVTQMPTGHAQMLMAIDYAIGPAHEIVIAGDPNADDTRAMLHTLNTTFIPNKVIVVHSDADPTPIEDLAPYTKGQISIDHKATAYVCQNYACQLPTTDPAKMLELLNPR